MKNLFSEFKPSSAAEWKTQLEKDLKGQTYESLIWHNENGFDIQPFFTSGTYQCEPAFTHADWEICVQGTSKDAAELNRFFLRNLNRGATSIALNLEGIDPVVALKGVSLEHIQSTFTLDPSHFNGFNKFIEDYSGSKGKIRTTLLPLNFSNAADLLSWKEIISYYKQNKLVKTVSVNALPHHNAGCLAYYEIAIIFSMLVEYLEELKNKNEIPGSDFVIKTGVNADFFIQIAKLRAIRRLWAVLKKDYTITNDLHIIVETSLTNKSVSDSYNNLLRTTIEAMAAVVGGCNELIVNSFDLLFRKDENLSERLAINQQLILKDESYLDKMADISCGSFYIENITDELASKGLETFKRFERSGGYFECLKNGTFKNEIASQADQRQEMVDKQEQVIIGVNKFRNEKEKIDMNAAALSRINDMSIQNAVLAYELEHFFNLKNA